MSDAVEFKSWLIQPGNHRTFQQVRQKLAALFKQEIEIKSWLDLYHVFEQSLGHTEEAIKWFAPILRANPPSSQTGATPKQILLYRGAYPNPNAEDAPPLGHIKKVTYRGQVVETVVKEAPEADDGLSARSRYYRGAKVDS